MQRSHLTRLAWILPAVLVSQLAAQGNRPPNTPVITEPTAAFLVLSPHDVHMEAAPFSDPDPGDQHAASDWEIWGGSPSQRVWVAANVKGVEKVHAHLGDGVFENSHTGWRRLFAKSRYLLRVRHRDDSGDPLTEWSNWASIVFDTGDADVKEPLQLDDVESSPAPSWMDPSGVAIDLPTGSPMPSLQIETGGGALLLRIEAAPGAGNLVVNPPPLARHLPVRVVIDPGNTGGNLVLPETDLTIIEHGCRAFTLRLPALNLLPFQTIVFWVSEEGATYIGNLLQTSPNFGSPARGLLPPWMPREPGYTVDVVASGFQLPVNIAFVPKPGSQPGDPKLYVTELYGTIKTVTNDGTVLTYASGLLNYTPSGSFPGSGEQGLTGIAVDPISGDVFCSNMWRNASRGQNYPRVVRLTSSDGGRTSSSRQVILDMQGESQGQSHQISCLEIVHGELYCHMGDGFSSSTARNLGSYRGKILRMNLDGSPVAGNPFYNGGTRDARDYVFAYGVRNPFGGAWRASDDFRYTVENGPDIDRFARIVMGRDYGWNGNNSSMSIFALYNWAPSRGPVNIAFVQPETFAGSGFPSGKMDHAFVTESGPTYAQGQQQNGKRITEFTLDPAGNLVSGPIPFVEYVGDGYATAVGLAAGPDGLYFTELYLDESSPGPTAAGARILAVRSGNPNDCNSNGEPDWCEIANGTAQDCNGNAVPDSCDIASGASRDLDRNGVPDECDPLSESADELSLAQGGRIDFTIDAGPARAGMTYLLLGSSSGTSPGIRLGATTLPLNGGNDPWFVLSMLTAGSPTFPNSIGQLDPAGRSATALVLPGNLPMSLAGVRLDHAYVVFDLATGGFPFASNAVPLRLRP